MEPVLAETNFFRPFAAAVVIAAAASETWIRGMRDVAGVGCRAVQEKFAVERENLPVQQLG